ncbi:P4 family phage/plasmid primase-like protein [Thiocapsa rosea]|uniref:P4 family phage/plasmid primase-like protein n=1 Tax=Thiocapsa rosea TaxID=69360 RepID=A0A495V3N2_9GAMM|nr:P4 family phage/plasmid primase-like protein [Thiocapsa rosea]
MTKSYRLSEDGKIIKDGQPFFIEGHAETVSLQSLSDLAEVIDNLKQHQCIATGVFDVPKCRVVTKDALDENAVASGVRARSKDYMKQPEIGVVLFDYDPSLNMPDRLRQYTPTQVIDTIRADLPELRKVGYIGRASSSSGVHETNQQPGMPKGFHIYCLFKNSDLKALKTYLEVKLWNEGYGYIEFARNGALLVRTLIDLAVLSPERLIYEAAPILGSGLSREPSPWKEGKGGPIDCDLNLTEEEICEYRDKVETAKAKAQEQSLRHKEAYLEEKASQLASDQQIPLDEAKQRISVEYRQEGEQIFLPSNFILEVKGKALTFGELLERADLDGATMPDPIEGRAYGTSTAKFYYNKGLNPCVNSFAHGGQVYRLEDSFNEISELQVEEAPQDDLMKAQNLVNSILDDVEGDVGIVFRDDVIAALRTIKHRDPPDYERLRTLFKKLNPGVSVQKLDKRTASRSSTGKSTHDGYARELLQIYTVESWGPIGYEDQLYVLNADTSVWVYVESNELIKTVSQEFDGQPNCTRSNDYKDIVKHAITISSQPGFFDDSPTGVACSEGFYRVEAGRMIREDLSPSHRQRLRLDYTPKEIPIPRFDQFLAETFGVEDEEEQRQQVQVVQEIFGGIMLGILHRYQKAVLFYDPIGRAGKGTIVDIIKSLLPRRFITSVSPYKFDEEYYLASIMTSRLNVAGELDSKKTIPENVLKMITGGDDITGRHPAGRPMTFKSQAAQLFMSNHMIRTSDKGEAFFARWQFVEFPNSRLRSNQPLDPDLAQTIISEERSGIAFWALQGGIRLLEQKHYSPSKAHDRLMKNWRRWADSLVYFIQEACETGDKEFSLKRSDFYSAYEQWCDEFGITPDRKRDVMDRILKFPEFAITSRRTNGYDMYYGVKLKAFEKIEV